MVRRFVLAVVANAIVASAAIAHQLNVFAYVEGGEIVVEAKFSNGKRPVSGEVRVRDGANELLTSLPLGSDGTLRLPLRSLDYSSGLVIEVETGEGHDDYWILTPDDIDRQTGD